MNLSLIILCTAGALALCLIVWIFVLRYKYKHIKLKCLFLTTNLENVFADLKQRTGVEISGILGNDFLKRYKYIIDYKHQKVYHGLNSMSLKGWIDLVDIPGVTLCQGNRKFHFLIDTGSNSSHISQKALQYLQYETHALDGEMTVAGGYGDSEVTNVILKTTMYYNVN